MEFKNPTLLWALLFLAIPILVHLFQLRRFKKVAFTNVAFLKPLISQTRKSRTLKKWLTLLTRLCAVACIVLAFAQPFIPGSKTAIKEKETSIYLDNSFSMQREAANGSLLQQSVQQLIETIPSSKSFNLITNDSEFKNVTLKEVKNNLLDLNYSKKSFDINQALLKANSLFSDKKNVKEIILISDFQKLNEEPLDTSKLSSVRIIEVNAPDKINIAIDSAFIFKETGINKELKVLLSSSSPIENAISIALNHKGKLIAKTSVEFENKKAIAQFNYTLGEPLTGQLNIQSNDLEFDNTLYVSEQEKQRVNILAINNEKDDFLKKLYKGDEFNLTSVNLNQLNYNLIPDQNLIILNELDDFSSELESALRRFKSNGGKLILIPSSEMTTAFLGITPLGQQVNADKKITNINFEHPLFKGVFNKRVSNFQYPTVSKVILPSKPVPSILTYEDNSSFLYEDNGTYIFTSSLNESISNFKSSPLIVPIFYNFAISSLSPGRLFYKTNQSDKITIPVNVKQDEIVTISNQEIEVIPQQKAFSNKVEIQTEGIDLSAGNYTLSYSGVAVGNISFNDDRLENKQSFYELQSLDTYSSVKDLMSQLSSEENITSLWQWFVCGALLFFLLETLILKYLK